MWGGQAGCRPSEGWRDASRDRGERRADAGPRGEENRRDPEVKGSDLGQSVTHGEGEMGVERGRQEWGKNVSKREGLSGNREREDAEGRTDRPTRAGHHRQTQAGEESWGRADGGIRRRVGKEAWGDG